MFDPAGASSLKNISPGLHSDGSVVPALIGRVLFAFVKSILLLCVRRSTSVWPWTAEMAAASSNAAAIRFILITGYPFLTGSTFAFFQFHPTRWVLANSGK